MRVCVVGAGAVGGHLAAKLARNGATVSLIARGAHLEAIRRDGLRYEAGGDSFVTRPRASQDPTELGEQDVVLVTAKANSLASLAPLIPPLLGRDTPVVFATNGVPWWYFHRFGNHAWRRIERLDPDGVLERHVGLERAVGCVVYSSNALEGPGVVRNVTPARNRFLFGEPDANNGKRAERVAALFQGTDIEAPVEPDIRKTVWNKLLVNMSNSAGTCLVGGRIGETMSDPGVGQMARRINEEMVAVAATHGIALTPGYTPEQIKATAASPVAGHKPSMLQDLEAGKPMEIDAQFVVPQEFAREAGIATPVFDTALALLRAKARQAGCYDG